MLQEEEERKARKREREDMLRRARENGKRMRELDK